MKKFYWKALYKKMGLIRLIGLIISLAISTFGIIWVFNDYGIGLVLESIGLTIVFDSVKELIKAFKETIKEYEIETK